MFLLPTNYSDITKDEIYNKIAIQNTAFPFPTIPKIDLLK